MMDGGMMGGMMAAWGIWAFLVILTLIAVLVVAVLGSVWLARQLRGGEGYQSASAEDVLRRRYAAGEIDDDEYRHRMSALQ
jgi:putative membrane protein